MRGRHPGCSQGLAGASYTQASKPAWTDRGQRLDARGQLGRRGQPSRGQAQAAASQLVGSQGCRVGCQAMRRAGTGQDFWSDASWQKRTPGFFWPGPSYDQISS